MVWPQEVSKICGNKKIKNHARVTFLPCPGRPTVAIALNFSVRVDITDLITHTKFYVNRFRGFGVLTPQFCNSP